MHTRCGKETLQRFRGHTSCYECDNPHTKVACDIHAHIQAPPSGLRVLRHPRPFRRMRNRAGLACAFLTSTTHTDCPDAVDNHHYDNDGALSGCAWNTRYHHSSTTRAAARGCSRPAFRGSRLDSWILDLAKQPLRMDRRPLGIATQRCSRLGAATLGAGGPWIQVLRGLLEIAFPVAAPLRAEFRNEFAGACLRRRKNGRGGEI
jgi:hypothetical protein